MRRQFSRWVKLLSAMIACGVIAPADAQIQPTSAVASPASATDPHPLAKPIEITQRAIESAKQVNSYTATLYRKMWLGREYSESTVRLKHRQQPFSVYLYFEQPHAGREVLFIDGWNKNRMYAHEGSGPLAFFGSISLDPNGSQAMEGSKYPITKIGVTNLATSVVEQWQQQLRVQQPSDVDVKLYPNAKLGDVPCKVIETVCRRQNPAVPFYRTRLYLTADSNIPFAVQQGGFPQQAGAEPPLLEDVRYLNLNTNAGLTAEDFNYKNPAYKF